MLCSTAMGTAFTISRFTHENALLDATKHLEFATPTKTTTTTTLNSRIETAATVDKPRNPETVQKLRFFVILPATTGSLGRWTTTPVQIVLFSFVTFPPLSTLFHPFSACGDGLGVHYLYQLINNIQKPRVLFERRQRQSRTRTLRRRRLPDAGHC